MFFWKEYDVPLNGSIGDWFWAPDHSMELIGVHPADKIADADHGSFALSSWCPHYMWNHYYTRNPDGRPVPPVPAGWHRNAQARVYQGILPDFDLAQHRAPPPPPPPRRAEPQPFLFDEPAPAPAHPRGEYKAPKDVKVLGVTKQPFFMPYDSDEEIRFRLMNSVITLNGEPVYVQDVGVGGRGTYNIHYTKQDGTSGVHGYKEGSGFDLTPLPARYILNENKHRKAYWCFRKPIRGVYRQGACNQNTFIHPAGDHHAQRIGGIQQIMDAYYKSNDVRYVSEFIDRLTADKPSVALSNSVSVYVKKLKLLGAKEDVFGLEYEGLELDTFTRGQFSGKTLELKYDGDLSPTTIRKLDMVGVNV